MFPIYVVEAGHPEDTDVFDGLDDVELSIEPFDVLNDEYLAWDSAGQFLRLETTEEAAFSKVGFLDLVLVVPRLLLRLLGRRPRHATEDRQHEHWLTLRHVTDADAEWLTAKVREHARGCGVEFDEAMLASATEMLRRLEAGQRRNMDGYPS